MKKLKINYFTLMFSLLISLGLFSLNFKKDNVKVNADALQNIDLELKASWYHRKDNIYYCVEFDGEHTASYIDGQEYKEFFSTYDKDNLSIAIENLLISSYQKSYRQITVTPKNNYTISFAGNSGLTSVELIFEVIDGEKVTEIGYPFNSNNRTDKWLQGDDYIEIDPVTKEENTYLVFYSLYYGDNNNAFSEILFSSEYTDIINDYNDKNYLTITFGDNSHISRNKPDYMINGLFDLTDFSISISDNQKGLYCWSKSCYSDNIACAKLRNNVIRYNVNEDANEVQYSQFCEYTTFDCDDPDDSDKIYRIDYSKVSANNFEGFFVAGDGDIDQTSYYTTAYAKYNSANGSYESFDNFSDVNNGDLVKVTLSLNSTGVNGVNFVWEDDFTGGTRTFYFYVKDREAIDLTVNDDFYHSSVHTMTYDGENHDLFTNYNSSLFSFKEENDKISTLSVKDTGYYEVEVTLNDILNYTFNNKNGSESRIYSFEVNKKAINIVNNPYSTLENLDELQSNNENRFDDILFTYTWSDDELVFFEDLENIEDFDKLDIKFYIKNVLQSSVLKSINPLDYDILDKFKFEFSLNEENAKNYYLDFDTTYTVPGEQIHFLSKDDSNKLIITYEFDALVIKSNMRNVSGYPYIYSGNILTADLTYNYINGVNYETGYESLHPEKLIIENLVSSKFKKYANVEFLYYENSEDTTGTPFNSIVEAGVYKIIYKIKDMYLDKVCLNAENLQQRIEDKNDTIVHTITVSKRQLKMGIDDNGYTYKITGDTYYVNYVYNDYHYLGSTYPDINYELFINDDNFQLNSGKFNHTFDDKYVNFFDFDLSDSYRNALTIKYYKLDGTEYVECDQSIKDAGEYKVTISVANSNLYELIEFFDGGNCNCHSSLDIKFVINKATVNPDSIVLVLDNDSTDSAYYTGNTISYKIAKGNYSYADIKAKLYFDEVNDENIVTEITNAGKYYVVFDSIDNQNYSYAGNSSNPQEITIDKARIQLFFDFEKLEYGLSYEELKNKVTLRIDNNKISDELKNYFLTIDWKLLKNQEEYGYYQNNEISTIVPGTYDIAIYVGHTDEAGDIYENELDTENYKFFTYSSLIIDRKPVEIIWTNDDFTYNNENQFDSVKAYYLDKDNNIVYLNVENTVSNNFKYADEYRFIASFNASLDEEGNPSQSDLYLLDTLSQKNYTMKKKAFDSSTVEFNDYKIEYDEFMKDTNLDNYISKVKASGIPEDIAVTYDLSSVRAYKGKYQISITLENDNYLLDESNNTFYAYFTIGVKKETITKQESEIAIIEANDEGDILDPTLKLIVEIVKVDDTKETVEAEIKEQTECNWKDKVISVYDVSLIDENNIKQQPDGTLKVYLEIPTDLNNQEFEIYHRHVSESGNVTISKMEYTIEDGYAVFITDKLSEFVFMKEYKSLIWLMIIISVLILGALALLFYQVYNFIKNNKNKKNAATMLSAAPIFIYPGHLEAVITLAIILGSLLIINLLFFLLIRIDYKKLFESIKSFINKIKAIFKSEPKEESKVVEAINNEPIINSEGLSLKESMSNLNKVNSSVAINKRTICNYLLKEHKNDTIVNNRKNYTAPSKGNLAGLPLADTHYVKLDEKNVCFTYIYENEKGSILILLRTSNEHISLLSKKHKNINLSRFPKVSSGLKWYSIPIDETYSINQVYELLDEAIAIQKDNSHIASCSEEKIVDSINGESINNDSWVNEVVEYVKNTEFDQESDENGLDCVAVFFKTPYKKLYYFEYEDIIYNKGDVVEYSRTKYDNRKVVVAIPKIKVDESKLKLPLKKLSNQRKEALK